MEDENINEEIYLANQLLDRASTYLSENNYVHAIECAEKSSALYQELMRKRGELRSSLIDKFTESLDILGVSYGRLEKYRCALGCWQQLSTLYVQLTTEGHKQYRYNLARTIFNLGASYSSLEDWALALPFYQQASTLYEELIAEGHTQYRSDLAQSLANSVDTHVELGDHTLALDSLQKLSTLYTELISEGYQQYRHDLAKSYSSAGVIHNRLGNSLLAAIHFQQAATLYAELVAEGHKQYRYDNALLFANSGFLFSKLENYEQALTLYQYASAIYTELESEGLKQCHSELAHSADYLGLSYFELKKYAQAIIHFQHATSLYTALINEGHTQYRYNLARSLDCSGESYYTLENYALALPLFKHAASLYAELISEGREQYLCNHARSLAWSGTSYLRLERLEMALRFFQQTSAIYAELINEGQKQYRSDLALSLVNLGESYFKLKNYSLALRFFQQASAIYAELINEGQKQYSPDLALSLVNLGGSYFKLKNYSLALPFLQQASAIYTELISEGQKQYRSNLAHALVNSGELYLSVESFELALPFFQKTATLYTELISEGQKQYHSDLAQSLVNSAELYLRLDNYALALPLFQQAATLYAKLITEGHQQYRSDLAKSSAGEAISYFKYENYASSIRQTQQAVYLYEILVSEGEKKYRHKLADSLVNLNSSYFMKNGYDPHKSNEIMLNAYNIYQEIIIEGLAQYKNELAELLRSWAAICAEAKDWPPHLSKAIEACHLRREIMLRNRTPETREALQNDLAYTISSLQMLVVQGIASPQMLFDMLAEFNALGLRREIATRQLKRNHPIALTLTNIHEERREYQQQIDQLRLQQLELHNPDLLAENQRNIEKHIEEDNNCNLRQQELESQLGLAKFDTARRTTQAIQDWLQQREVQQQSSSNIKPTTWQQRVKTFFSSNKTNNNIYREAVLLIADTSYAETFTHRGLFALLLTAEGEIQHIALPETWLALTSPHKTGRGFRLAVNNPEMTTQASYVNFTKLHPQMMDELWRKLPLNSFGHIHLVVQGKKASTLPWQASLQLAYPSLVGKVSLHAGVALLPIEDTNHTRDKTPAWPQDWRILGYGENYHYRLHDELPMACLEATLWRKHVSTNTQAPLFEHMGNYVHQAGLNDPVAWVLCVHGDASTDFPHAARLKIAPQQRSKDSGELVEDDSNAFVDVSDLMRHEQAPLWVYLSACVAGTVTDQATDPTGLPIGFLLNNTQLVIGSNQALDDVWACVLSVLFLDRLLTFKECEPEVQLQHIRLAFEQARSALLDGRLAIYNPDLRQDWHTKLKQAQGDQNSVLHQRFLGMTDSIFHALKTLIQKLPENTEFNLQTYNAVIEQQVTALQGRILLSDTSRDLLDNLGKRYVETIQHCQNHVEIRGALQEVPIMGTDVVLMKDYITQLIDWTTPDYYKKDMRCPVPQEAIETAASMVVFG